MREREREREGGRERERERERVQLYLEIGHDCGKMKVEQIFTPDLLCSLPI